jgi:hypothetical protein
MPAAEISEEDRQYVDEMFAALELTFADELDEDEEAKSNLIKEIIEAARANDSNSIAAIIYDQMEQEKLQATEDTTEDVTEAVIVEAVSTFVNDKSERAASSSASAITEIPSAPPPVAPSPTAPPAAATAPQVSAQDVKNARDNSTILYALFTEDVIKNLKVGGAKLTSLDMMQRFSSQLRTKLSEILSEATPENKVETADQIIAALGAAGFDTSAELTGAVKESVAAFNEHRDLHIPLKDDLAKLQGISVRLKDLHKAFAEKIFAEYDALKSGWLACVKEINEVHPATLLMLNTTAAKDIPKNIDTPIYDKCKFISEQFAVPAMPTASILTLAALLKDKANTIAQDHGIVLPAPTAPARKPATPAGPHPEDVDPGGAAATAKEHPPRPETTPRRGFWNRGAGRGATTQSLEDRLKSSLATSHIADKTIVPVKTTMMHPQKRCNIVSSISGAVESQVRANKDGSTTLQLSKDLKDKEKIKANAKIWLINQLAKFGTSDVVLNFPNSKDKEARAQTILFVNALLELVQDDPDVKNLQGNRKVQFDTDPKLGIKFGPPKEPTPAAPATSAPPSPQI